ncbi:cyclophilin-like domain-containing protein [Bombardia bombarda]|uniref:peptidylprolyl isomerase n=1 Tax=Bombardia bombarda TaxID=252184 RepID=A0AA39XKK8_9PEZI|nr:cyclophilin-like domain-containing protein [Bombardia bombarda]
MSTIYNLEPQPTAFAIIHTTQGELSVELFAKQTPLTCRNFLQLSLDGYYDNTIFHRLVPGFILQGGDPSGTGHGGESIFDNGALSGDLDPWPMDQRRGKNAGPMGVNFKDEFHSRLRFNRRGLLGMANEGAPDTNSSQFFFTLGKTEELANKNTVFGRVAGDTIYNLARMGESEVEEGGERPLYPIKITHIEILINPFGDMKKRERKLREQAQRAAPVEKKQKKRKGGKQLLSFGDEVGDDDNDLPVVKKAKFDTRIVMDVEEEEPPKRNTSAKSTGKKEAKSQTKEPQVRELPTREVLRNPSPPKTARPRKESPPARPRYSDKSSPEPERSDKKTLLERTNEEIAAVKASMKRTIHSEPIKEQKKSALEQLIPETSIRGRKRRPGATTTREEQEALDLLKSFRQKLEQAPVEKSVAHPSMPEDGENAGDAGEDGEGEVCDLHFIANCQSCKAWDKLDDKEDSDDEGWMSHTLSFAADKLGKDLSYRKKAEEELVVIDPRAKARTLQEEKKAARDARSGATSRAWDRARK